MSVRVMLFGHSFVTRLYNYINTGTTQINLPDNLQFRFAGFPGLTLANAFQHVHHIDSFRPHILILELGTNDLADPYSSPAALARDILLFAQFLIDTCSVSLVVINQIYFRAPTARRTRPDFNIQAERYHDLLRASIHNFPHVLTQFHRNMQANWQDMLLHDGVHLNPYTPHAKPAMRRYLLSIKDAAIKAARLLPSDASPAATPPAQLVLQ